MPYTIKPGSFKYKKSNGQFSEIDCFEGPDLTEEVAALEKGKAPIIIDSATGNPIAIKDGADDLPVEGMKIHFSPIQSGTGDPSPSNIRPISGFDGINIFRTGVNIWDEELELGGINSSTGVPYTSTSALRAKNYIPVVPGEKYYFKSSSASSTRCWYDKDKNYISTGYVVNMEITAPDNAYFFRFDLPSSYGTTYNHDISLNYPSTDTEYHPYTGQSYPVIFPALGKNLMNSPSFGDSGVLLNDFRKDTYFDAITFSFKANNTSAQYTNAAVVDLREEDGTHHYIVLSVCKNSSNVAFKANTETSGTYSRTLTNIKFRYVYAWYTGSSYSYFNGDNITEWQLELGTAATTYEPYIDAIYGGTLDAVNGMLMVTHKKIRVLNEVGGVSSTYPGSFFINSIQLPDANISKAYICNRLKYIGRTLEGFGVGTCINNGGASFNLWVRDSVFNSLQQCKDWLAENETEICYELATPYEIHLDPITVQTLLGNNAIWSNANGYIELNYRADTKLFCQKNDSVDDVRVNGTSVLNNGVANIPLADGSTWGAVKIGSGLYVGTTSGVLQTNRASSAQIKAATNNNNPIVPQMQHESIFYGLAKLAGADMSSSSNAIGTFTPEAIVAIQKMLGVYQAPWELIREDTFTNATEANHVITVDSNGQPLQLTDVILYFETPVQDTYASKGVYGQLWFNDQDDYRYAPECGSWTQSAGNISTYACGAIIEQKDGMLFIGNLSSTTNTNNSNFRYRYMQGFKNSQNGLLLKDTLVIIKNITIPAVTGTGHYIIYGKRKWTT